jgi:SurA N-terminal domain
MTRTHRTAATVVAVAATLLLTACNPAQAGSAATVGDVRITESEVNQSASEALAAASADAQTASTGLDSATFLRQTTNRYITSELLAIAAAEEGITVSQAEIDTVIAQASNGVPVEQFEAQLAAQFAVPPSGLNDFVHDFVLHSKLGAKLDPSGDSTAQRAAADARLVQVADRVGVTVSPRYGQWNPEKATIDSDLNDLSATPTPSSSPSGPAPAE